MCFAKVHTTLKQNLRYSVREPSALVFIFALESMFLGVKEFCIGFYVNYVFIHLNLTILKRAKSQTIVVIRIETSKRFVNRTIRITTKILEQ